MPEGNRPGSRPQNRGGARGYIPSVDALRAGVRQPEPAPQNSPQNSGRVPNIAIHDAQVVRNGGNLKMLADLKIGPLIVKSWRVIQQPDQAPWVGVPSLVREEDDPERPGQKRRKYYALLDVPPAWKTRIDELLLGTWTDYLASGILPNAAAIGRGEVRQ